MATATPTRWEPPETVLALGALVTHRYDHAPPWVGPPPSGTCGHNPGCTGGPTPGARKLGAYIERYFPGVRDVQGYCCRPDTGAPGLVSIHGTGRAIDVVFSGRANPDGTQLANWIVAHARPLGVQHVIWDHMVWTVLGGHPHLSRYGGPSPHTDHVHLELTRDAAQERLPWYQDPDPPPPVDLEHPGDELEGATSSAPARGLVAVGLGALVGLAAAAALRAMQRRPRRRAA